VEEGSFLQEGDAGGAPVAPKKEKLAEMHRSNGRGKNVFARSSNSERRSKIHRTP
jgi:hypothetical protein